jgi:hypothetical protein
MRAAEYYRRPPWELLHMPLAWTRMASMMMDADQHADKMKRQRQQQWL